MRIFWIVHFPSYLFSQMTYMNVHYLMISLWTRPIYYLKPLEIDSKLAFISSNFWFPDYLQVWLLIGVFMKDSFIFGHINSLSTQLRENTCLVHCRDPPLVTLHFKIKKNLVTNSPKKYEVFYSYLIITDLTQIISFILEVPSQLNWIY